MGKKPVCSMYRHWKLKALKANNHIKLHSLSIPQIWHFTNQSFFFNSDTFGFFQSLLLVFYNINYVFQTLSKNNEIEKKYQYSDWFGSFEGLLVRRSFSVCCRSFSGNSLWPGGISGSGVFAILSSSVFFQCSLRTWRLRKRLTNVIIYT